MIQRINVLPVLIIGELQLRTSCIFFLTNFQIIISPHSETSFLSGMKRVSSPCIITSPWFHKLCIKQWKEIKKNEFPINCDTLSIR